MKSTLCLILFVSENKIDELEMIEKEEFSLFADFLGDLKNHKENGSSLLTNTAVLFGSNLGNGSCF